MGTRDLLFLALIYRLAWAGTMESCAHRCGERLNKAAECQCNHQCEQHKDCCEDYKKLCTSQEGPKEMETETEWEEKTAPDSNLYLAPNSCHSRCHEAFDKHHPCHCNSKCQKFGNCCEDYESLCAHDGFSRSSDAITKEELLTISEKIYKADTNKALKEDIILNSQNRISPSETNDQVDRCPEPYSSEQEFVSDLKNMWFGLYSRGNDEGDSSGFEHVFSGEVKKGKVTGFHNWIRFYLQEKEGLVDYYSHNYDGPWDSYPDVLGMQFNWDGYYKEVGSAFIGSSPEFEFALYSLCFISRPGGVCHLSLGGYPLAIQTYTWDKTTYGNGKKYIATAYVVSSMN
ncbi:uridylate-specific endoribonuclease isoform X4 [Petaurus breviceps papuanus]|uniref:uridylate-specific endoribonuclease isoform X4 n=1 Tax=Petaurus breviceps papuanus TaxID=3040969 RepID=UPI0036D8D8DC